MKDAAARARSCNVCMLPCRSRTSRLWELCRSVLGFGGRWRTHPAVWRLLQSNMVTGGCSNNRGARGPRRQHGRARAREDRRSDAACRARRSGSTCSESKEGAAQRVQDGATLQRVAPHSGCKMAPPYSGKAPTARRATVPQTKRRWSHSAVART
eukprot:1970747-Prymnesium_polylepis.1